MNSHGANNWSQFILLKTWLRSLQANLQTGRDRMVKLKHVFSQFAPFHVYIQKVMQGKGRKIENGITSAILGSCLAPLPNICGPTLAVPPSHNFCLLAWLYFLPNNSFRKVKRDTEFTKANNLIVNNSFWRVYWCHDVKSPIMFLLEIFSRRGTGGLTFENCPLCSVWKPLQVLLKTKSVYCASQSLGHKLCRAVQVQTEPCFDRDGWAQTLLW